jgi:hypothetical protein
LLHLLESARAATFGHHEWEAAEQPLHIHDKITIVRMYNCRYCIATRPKLQQQLQQELAAAGITSSTIVSAPAAAANHSTCNGSSDAAKQQDQDLAPAGPEDSSSSSGKTSAAGMKQQQGAAVTAEVLQQRRQQLLDAFAAAGPDLLKQLPLLQACLYEAMRLYPAGAPGAPR